MQSLVTLLISGVLLATVAHAQQYWCENNGKQGTTTMPAFVANDAGTGWELPLGSTAITSANSCIGNVEAFPGTDNCDNPFSAGSGSSARAASGAYTASIADTTLNTYCYLPRGECNLKLCVKAAYEAVECGSFNSGSWADYSGGFSDGVATVSGVNVYTAGLQDQREACDDVVSGGDGCYKIEVGYVSACGACDNSATVIYTGQYAYSEICTEDSLQITENITSMDIDLGALSQDAVMTSPSSSTDSNAFTASTISAEFGVNDFQVPYLIPGAVTDGSWAADASRHTGAILVSGNYHLVIKPATAGTARLIAACNAMEEGSRPDGWSSNCDDAEFGDCFEITEGQDSYECEGTVNEDTDSGRTMTWDSNTPQYHASININCPTDDNCCHQITLEVKAASGDTCSRTTSYPAGGRRRLGDSSGRANRYLQEDEDRKLFGMSYSMAVQTSGDDSSEFVGGADPSRVSDSGGSAGWLPAVAVGGLLLLGGAVVAVTRRPSLLRGAFHGPTKVLPNEDN